MTPPLRGIAAAAPAVLVVDDDDLVLALTARVIGTAGHPVVTAVNGAAALRIVDDGVPVSCVVSDVMMPGMNGLELARAIRARQPALPVILMTGYEPPDIRNVDHFDLPVLLKPVARHALLEAVGRALRSAEDTTVLCPAPG